MIRVRLGLNLTLKLEFKGKISSQNSPKYEVNVITKVRGYINMNFMVRIYPPSLDKSEK